MPKGVEPLALLLDLQDFERLPEDPGEIALSKEMVVVVPVDDPIAPAALTRVVLEAGAEGGQVEVAAGLEERPEAAQVPGPVGLFHMMEAPTVQQGIEAPLPKGEAKGIREHKGQARADRASLSTRAGLP